MVSFVEADQWLEIDGKYHPVNLDASSYLVPSHFPPVLQTHVLEELKMSGYAVK